MKIRQSSIPIDKKVYRIGTNGYYLHQHFKINEFMNKIMGLPVMGSHNFYKKETVRDGFKY